ncbi:MAG: beta-galactosidase/beta-glucuronidase [Chloroflexi bacterium]|jgi:beta-galactosidase/beta-glucuronidase|nr:beta-galactosidase/beta-glucuronidase [Chloroflexota bacterium]
MERDENHPRPQLIRENWTDLGGKWGFAYDDSNVGLNEGWETRSEVFNKIITVPFPPESEASGIGDKAFHPVVWYRRTFQPDPAHRQGRLLLHFGAVDYQALVWVNNRLVAQHEGGNTPFTADITTALDPEKADQVIVVRAEDQPTDLTQPRGKQYWEKQPRRIWYDRTTGIWQPVWLEYVAETYIAEIRWTPDLDRGLLGVEVKLNQKPARPLKLHIELSIRGISLAEDDIKVERSEVRREIALEPGEVTMNREEILWSPMYPNLIDAELSLREGDRVQDRVLSYAGLRSAAFNRGYFLLNGRPYYLRLALEQGYWPETHLAAPSNEALKREVGLAKELGFNGVRIHQKVEDPRFLYWCDRLGLLVWGEMANAYVFSATAIEKFTREWLDVVRRDYSHPCIITWVPLNESWGVPNLEQDSMQRSYVKALYNLTHALDGTRPVIGNDGWEHVVGDVWGIHDYAPSGSIIRERYGSAEAVKQALAQTQPHYRNLILPENTHKGEPVMLTEVGGFSLSPGQGEAWWGYATAHDNESFLAKYTDLIQAILDCPTITGFCYTQLTDTGQETNGLLRADRTSKLDPKAIKAVTAGPTKAMPGEIIKNIQLATEITSFQEGGV